ncbi:hypothetical protein V9K67_10985 [Paraflavisolibacter sp. H34]
MICNLFFLLAVLLQYKNFIGEEKVVSTIVIIGYFLAVFVFNPLVHLLYLAVFSFRRRLFDWVPKWLVAANFLFLLLQIIYIILFLNNDTFYS